MKFRLSLTIITLLLVKPLFAHHRGPIPVTPAEKAFFTYLEEVSKISFADSIPLDPWIECDDQNDKSTFFSASINQFSDSNGHDSPLQDWLTSFLDHAFWARVSSATCLYEANHFNECFANGSFRVVFRSKRIIGFQKISQEKFCTSESSTKSL